MGMEMMLVANTPYCCRKRCGGGDLSNSSPGHPAGKQNFNNNNKMKDTCQCSSSSRSRTAAQCPSYSRDMSASSSWHYWIAVWIVMLYLVTWTSAAEASWDTGNVEIQQGKDLTITCTVDNVDPMGVVRIEHTVIPTHVVSVITDNGNIKPHFAKTGRYNITEAWSSTSMTVSLSYNNIRGEDTGKISCSQLGQEKDAASVIVRVLVPVDELYLMLKTGDGEEYRLEPDSTIHIRQGEETRIQCVALIDGSEQPADMALEIGGQSEMKKFLREDFPKTEKPNGSLGKKSTDVKLTYETTSPPAEFNEKNLTCKASALGFDVEEVTVRLNIQFAPIITCPKYEWFGQLGRKIRINCDVHANPGSTIHWYYGEERDTAELVPRGRKKGATFLTGEKAFGEDHAHVSLTITKLNESHLTNFYLSAKNDIDTKELTLTVNEGARDVEPEVEKQNPSNPSYSTNNKPSKRPQPRDPQRVLSGDAGLGAHVSTFVLVCSLLLSTCQYALLQYR